jgi:hypothetical protein
MIATGGSPKPRIPAAILTLLREGVALLERGPDPDSLQGAGRSEDFKAGMADEAWRQKAWRDSWLVPPLRQVLAYAEGRCSVTDIKIYGLGTEKRG